MNETKQTAVEWLLFELSKNGLLPDGIPIDIHQQAKEMEREQMKHWFGLGMHLVEGKLWKPIDKFEENFNETYGGNKIQCQCQFEMDTSTSSATKCKFCGKEKWQHVTHIIGRI